MYSELNIKRLETYGFAEAELLINPSNLYQRIICAPDSQLKDKSDFLTLWTKAIFYDKACFASRICREHQADWLSAFSVSFVVKNNSCLSVFVAKIRVNPRNPRLKYYQSIMTFYAKQTQF